MTKLIEFFRYCFFGGITVTLNLGLFIYFKEIGIYYIAANGIAYVIAVIVNYFLNKFFVFRSTTQKQTLSTFLQFILVRIVSLIIDSVLFFILVDMIHLNVYLSRFGLSAAIIIATFFINKRMIFK